MSDDESDATKAMKTAEELRTVADRIERGEIDTAIVLHDCGEGDGGVGAVVMAGEITMVLGIIEVFKLQVLKGMGRGEFMS